MKNGKAAGERCIHLSGDMACNLYNDPSRPAVCSAFMAEEEFCGKNRDEAYEILYSLSI